MISTWPMLIISPQENRKNEMVSNFSKIWKTYNNIIKVFTVIRGKKCLCVERDVRNELEVYLQSRIPMLYYKRRLYKHISLLKTSCVWAADRELHAPLAPYYKWRLCNFCETRPQDDKKEGILGERAGQPKPTMSQETLSRRFKVRATLEPDSLGGQHFGYQIRPQHHTPN